MTMSTARKPIGDCGPEFGRRFERELRSTIRHDGHETSRRFAARMFEIGRTADRFDRAERIQAECDRLLTLSDAEITMTVSSIDPAPLTATPAPVAPPVRPWEGRGSARAAEGATRPAPSALFAFVRMALEAAALCAFAAGVMLMADALLGRG
jgi:hypothetical protein